MRLLVRDETDQETMMSDENEEFANQIRKFLREVGVTSQQQIERAVGASGKPNGRIKLRMHLSSPDIPLDHVVERELDLG